MPLEIEIAYFNDHRDAWITGGHEGEWCVVLADNLLGFFDAFSSAYEAGVEAFGDDASFLVKQVLPEDPVATIQRVYWPFDEQASIQ